MREDTMQATIGRPACVRCWQMAIRSNAPFCRITMAYLFPPFRRTEWASCGHEKLCIPKEILQGKQIFRFVSNPTYSAPCIRIRSIPPTLRIQQQRRLSNRLLPGLAAIAFFMESLDTTILNTAVPAISNSLKVPPLHPLL